MPSFSELLKNKAVQIAIAIVAVILVGSVTYYLIEAAPPKLTYATVTTGTITEDVTGSGTVTPVQNPTLSFEVGGLVTHVSATVGTKVAAGTLLASLDTSVLQANLAAAQAKLNALEVGPRSVDVAGQQTAVATAQSSYNNTLANLPTTLQSAYAQTQAAVTTEADPMFDFSYRATPALSFTTLNANTKITADSNRANLNTVFTNWSSEIPSATSSPSAQELETASAQTLANLHTVQTFLNDLIAALNDAQVGPSFTQTQQETDLASVHTALNTVNGLITSVQAASQSITTQQLAVQSAQDQLTQTLAGATPQDIQAQQAAVAAIEAQIRQEEIVAPFAGTVASVSVKSGDTVSAGQQAVALIPEGNFEVDVYLAQNDMTKVKVGDAADVTLDAYGTNRIFPATVASIETSPTVSAATNNVAAYKVVLIFANADPAIANGMSANATIHAGSAQNALIIPASAVITVGTQSYVLKETLQGPVKTEITTGLSNDTQMQVLSGLSAGDKVSAVGSQT